MKTARERLSASSLRQLMSCALQWKLQRLDDLDGAKPSHRSPSLILGRAYHEAVANALIALHQGKVVQATAYVYAAKHLGYGDCELQFHIMSKAKKPKLSVVSAPRTEDNFDRLYAIARDAERLIDAGIFLPKSPDWMCAGCSYRAACAKAYCKTRIPVREAAPAA